MQLRYGGDLNYVEGPVDRSFAGITDESDVEKIISERLVIFSMIFSIVYLGLHLFVESLLS